MCVQGWVSDPSVLPSSPSSPQWPREMGMGVVVTSSQVVSIAAQGEESPSLLQQGIPLVGDSFS